MANMSYCRFQNTANDLEDCVEHMDDDLSDSELRAQSRIVDMAYEIVEWHRGKGD